MTCCPHCQGADKFFNQRIAAAELRDYHRHGPSGTTERLLDALRASGVRGMSLLDVGGGIGVIQHELRAAGVTAVTDVDASRSYLKIARHEAEKRGYVADAQYIFGDFVALAGEIEPADIVTLDRVICCYPDVEGLVHAAAARAQRLLGLVYPRDTWWAKAGIAFLNLYPRLRNDPFRVYVHPTATVEGIIADYGLRKVAQHDGPIWQVAVFAGKAPE